jgi:hypothetical protein
VVAEYGLQQPEGCRTLNTAGLLAVEATAEKMAATVDELLREHWDRKTGSFIDLGVAIPASGKEIESEKVATCSCNSGIPVQKILIDGREVTLVALPLIFEQFRQAGKKPSQACARELLDTVKIYNTLPAGMDEQYLAALMQEYTNFCQEGTAG